MSNGIRFVNIGFGSLVNAGRIIAVVSADSAPVKRLLRDAEDRNQLVDATFGRKVRTVLVMDSGHVVLSAIQPETIAGRMQGDREEKKEL